MPEIRLRVTTDADTQPLDEAATGVERLQGRVSKLTVPAAAVAAAFVAGGTVVKNYASEAEQAIGSTEAVFGAYAETVQQLASTADQALGLSEASYNGLASTIGGSLRAAGFDVDELAGKTDDMLHAAADVSSVFGGEVSDAAGAMGAALRGEFDSLEQFGIFLNMAAVDAELARTGQDKLSGAALDAAKKQATYNLVMEQAGQYAGNFAKEADTAAGAEARAAAARENAAAALGSAILPAWTAFQLQLAEAARWVSENSTAVLILVGVIGALAGGVLAVNAALTVWTAAQTAAKAATAVWTGVQAAFNAVMALNPVVLVTLAVVALIAAVVLAYQRVGWFRDLVNAAGRAMQAAWRAVTAALSAAWSSFTSSASSLFRSVSSVVMSLFASWRSTFTSVVSALRSGWQSATSFIGSAIRTAGSVVSSVMSGIRSAVNTALSVVRSIGSAFRSAAGTASGAIDGVISTVRSLISWVGSALDKVSGLSSIGSGIRSFFGSAYMRPAVTAPTDGSPFYLTAAAAMMVPPSVFAPASRGGGGGRTTVVNIYGAIDPNRTARQLRRVLDDDDRRDGGDDLWT